VRTFEICVVLMIVIKYRYKC